MNTKKTPKQWAEHYGVIIRDPDGWRMANAPSMDTPIDKKEWETRLGLSTIEVVDQEKWYHSWQR